MDEERKRGRPIGAYTLPEWIATGTVVGTSRMAEKLKRLRQATKDVKDVYFAPTFFPQDDIHTYLADQYAAS